MKPGPFKILTRAYSKRFILEGHEFFPVELSQRAKMSRSVNFTVFEVWRGIARSVVREMFRIADSVKILRLEKLALYGSRFGSGKLRTSVYPVFRKTVTDGGAVLRGPQ